MGSRDTIWLEKEACFTYCHRFAWELMQFLNYRKGFGIYASTESDSVWSFIKIHPCYSLLSGEPKVKLHSTGSACSMIDPPAVLTTGWFGATLKSPLLGHAPHVHVKSGASSQGPKSATVTSPTWPCREKPETYTPQTHSREIGRNTQHLHGTNQNGEPAEARLQLFREQNELEMFCGPCLREAFG